MLIEMITGFQHYNLQVEHCQATEVDLKKEGID